MEILALIPARSGSKGVLKKNIKLLGDYPLLSYSIAAAKLSTKISRVIVSTDTQEIADIAKKYGAEVPFLRPKEFSRDTSQDMDFINHALKYLAKFEGYYPDFLVLLRPTTPLREVQFLDEAVDEMLKNSLANSLRSAHEAPESPFKWFSQKNGFYTSICSEIALSETNKPRQSFQEVYIPNGYVDILRVKQIHETHDMYGDKILAFITPHGYEIDTLEEFEYIEYLLSKHPTELENYLKKEAKICK